MYTHFLFLMGFSLLSGCMNLYPHQVMRVSSPSTVAHVVYSTNLRPAFAKCKVCSHTWRRLSYLRQAYSQKRKVGLMKIKELSQGQVSVMEAPVFPLLRVGHPSPPGSLLTIQCRERIMPPTVPRSFGHANNPHICFPVFCFLLGVLRNHFCF